MIKEIAIYKPGNIQVTYRINDALFSVDESGKKKKLNYKPTKITEEDGLIVTVEFSNKMVLVFKGFPIIFEM